MKANILLVDDSPLDRKYYTEILGDEWRVTQARDAGQAFTLLREEGPFAVVVADIVMPGMDGLAFLSRVAELHPASVRLVLTANTSAKHLLEAVNESRIFAFMDKAWDEERIKNQIYQAVEQHHRTTPERGRGYMNGRSLLTAEEMDFFRAKKD
jgi:DNA-binding NtrC family response regulator